MSQRDGPPTNNNVSLIFTQLTRGHRASKHQGSFGMPRASAGEARGGARDTSVPASKRTKREHVVLKVELESPVRRDGSHLGASTSTAALAATPMSHGTTQAPFTPPSDWPEVLSSIKHSRLKGGAPVDTMGCEKISDDAAPSAKGRRFVTLVSAMLSSQTKDGITHAATGRLVRFGCTPEQIAETPVEVLDDLITPVGFHTRKAQYLKRASRICVQKWNGDIPNTLHALMELPGVGPKMAYLVMNVGWGQNSGICVDVHVHRIAERLGWVPKTVVSSNGTPKKNKSPEDTRKVLQQWLPQTEWVAINPLLVGHGQLVCLPRNPRCAVCVVNDRCASAFEEGTEKKAEKKLEAKKKDD